MPTKSALVSDIILRITKGKPSDDLELEPKQVAYWIDMVLGSLVKQSLDAKLQAKPKQIIDPSYICWEKELDPKVKSLLTKSEFYLELCNDPMNLFRDGGVIRVNTSDGEWVDKMNMAEIDNISKLKFSKPSLKNIKYTRVKNKLYLYGLTIDTFILTKFDVAYIPKVQLLDNLSDDDEVFVGEDILPQVADEVEKLARRQMYQSGEDLLNNATQDLGGADGQ